MSFERLEEDGAKAPVLRPEVAAFVTRQYDDWMAGRRIACWAYRAFIALGAVAMAVGAIIGTAVAVMTLWRQMSGHGTN